MLVNDFGGLTPTSLLIIIWIFTSTAIIFVILRTFIRFYVHRTVSIDLACVYLALAILISTAGIYTKITPAMFELDLISSGQRRPTAGFQERADLFLRCQFALIVLFWTSVWAVKFSILMFYRDLFDRLPRQRKHWWFVFGFVAFSYLACWATQLASCWPIASYFHIGQCDNKRDTAASNASLYVTAALDIVGDLLMMALLLRQLYGLQTTQINRKQKIAVAGIFSLGAVIVIVAIVRVVEIKATTKHVDPVWLALWSVIEASVAVIISCLPSFRLLLSARSRSSSAYKRRHRSSTTSQKRSTLRRTSTIRLEAVAKDTRGNRWFRKGAEGAQKEAAGKKEGYTTPWPRDFGSADSMHSHSNRPSFDHAALAGGARRGTVVATAQRGGSESQEEILPPRNRVVVRQDVYVDSEVV